MMAGPRGGAAAKTGTIEEMGPRSAARNLSALAFLPPRESLTFRRLSYRSHSKQSLSFHSSSVKIKRYFKSFVSRPVHKRSAPMASAATSQWTALANIHSTGSGSPAMSPSPWSRNRNRKVR